MCQQLDAHIKDNKLSANNQGGFKQSRSTESFQLNITTDLKESVYN